MRLAGRVALVTGASRGIGAAVARALAAEGVRLGLASRSGTDLGLAGAVAGPCDVRDLAQLERLVAATAERFGRLDALVACAGVGTIGPFRELPLAELDEMVDVNVRGTIYAVRAALPQLAAGGGDVVVVTSGAAGRGLPGRAVYCATKFAQDGLVRALDHELRPLGVRCTAVAPGGTRTEFAFGRGREPGQPELETMLPPEAVAEAVLFALARPRGQIVNQIALQPTSDPPLR